MAAIRITTDVLAINIHILAVAILAFLLTTAVAAAIILTICVHVVAINIFSQLSILVAISVNYTPATVVFHIITATIILLPVIPTVFAKGKW